MIDKISQIPDLYETEPSEIYIPKGLSEYEENVVLNGHRVITELNERVIRHIGKQVDFRPFYILFLKDFEKEFSNLSLNDDLRLREIKRIENIIDAISEKTAEQAMEDHRNYEMNLYKYPL